MNFQQVLNKYREECFSERDKGTRFETLMKYYLKTDPMYSNEFSEIWLWSEFPFRSQFGGKDIGIDLVAKEVEGGYTAIQCKCYRETARIDKPEVDTFLSTSGKSFEDEDGEFIDTYELDEIALNNAQQDILDEWAQTNRESCERGTAIHAELEHSLTKNKTCEFKKYGLGGKFNVYSGDNPLDDRGIYPEYLIHVEDGDLRLAGQIDLLIKDGNTIHIIDYKTNRKLDEKSFYDSRTKKNQMMKYPLNNIMDCNKLHYNLQLSIYAWMLQQNNPDLEVGKLIIVHYDHKGNVTEYELPYLKEDVERLMKYWKNRAKIERQKEKRKPIEF